jgi:hypothetical protein
VGFEKAIDASNEMAAAGRPRSREGGNAGRPAHFGHTHQAASVLSWRACTRHDPVVTRHFPFEIDLTAYPGSAGMDPERGIKKRLDQADPIVAPLHMPVFVEHDLIELAAREQLEE